MGLQSPDQVGVDARLQQLSQTWSIGVEGDATAHAAMVCGVRAMGAMGAVGTVG
jgi:hypothetical protein